jgi:hypothetical protein
MYDRRIYFYEWDTSMFDERGFLRHPCNKILF